MAKHLLCAFLVAVLSFPAFGQTTGSLEGSTGDSKILPIRLCSTDRVLQTESDPAGIFKLMNVPVGKYELVVGDLFPVVKSVSIKADEVASVAFGEADLLVARESSCYRDARLPPCDPTTFKITYGEVERRPLAFLSGQVQNPIGRKRKAVASAEITLMSSGSTVPVYSATTDRKGRFQLAIPQGLYDLTFWREGFQEGTISKVLLPRDNVTQFLVLMMRTGSLTICSDQ